MFGVGRDLCGSSSPIPLPKQGHLQQAAQDLDQAGLEYLQRRRLHNLPGQPVPGLHHPQSEEVLPHLQMELPVLQFVLPIAPCPVAGHHWKVWPHPPDTHPSDICKYILGPLAAFSSSGWTSPAPSAFPHDRLCWRVHECHVSLHVSLLGHPSHQQLVIPHTRPSRRDHRAPFSSHALSHRPFPTTPAALLGAGLFPTSSTPPPCTPLSSPFSLLGKEVTGGPKAEL